MYLLHPKLRAADTGGPPLRPTPLSSYPSSVFAELPAFRFKHLYVSILHRFPARILEGKTYVHAPRIVQFKKGFLGVSGGTWGSRKSLGGVPWGVIPKKAPPLRLGKPFPTQGVSLDFARICPWHSYCPVRCLCFRSSCLVLSFLVLSCHLLAPLLARFGLPTWLPKSTDIG